MNYYWEQWTKTLFGLILNGKEIASVGEHDITFKWYCLKLDKPNVSLLTSQQFESLEEAKKYVESVLL